MDNNEEIADAFNRLFELNFDWSFQKNLTTVSRSEIEEAARLCAFIADRLSRKEVQNALWVLQIHKIYISHAAYRIEYIRSLSMTTDECDRIYKNLHSSITQEALVLEGRLGYPRKEFRDLSEEQKVEILKHFYQEEENILHRSGLNQASIAAIIARLKHFEREIISNICKSKSVLTGKYAKSLNAMVTFVERLRKSDR